MIGLRNYDRCSVHAALIALGKHFGFRSFIESGTYQGITAKAMADSFDNVVTIELPQYYDVAWNNLKDLRNVDRLAGSSGSVLYSLLVTRRIPSALFFLDAHGDKGDLTAENQVPSELDSIQSFSPTSIVVIDDVTKKNSLLEINKTYRLDWHPFWNCKHFPQMQVAVLWPRDSRFATDMELE
jgi:hypothetical protein